MDSHSYGNVFPTKCIQLDIKAKSTYKSKEKITLCISLYVTMTWKRNKRSCVSTDEHFTVFHFILGKREYE